MVPRVSTLRFFGSKEFCCFPCFQTLFRVQRNLLFPCFQTLLVFKGFCFFPVSRRFPYSRDFGVSLFPDTLTFQKCLETGKTTKSIEKIIIVKGFCHFSCLQTLSGFKSVQKQVKRPNPLKIMFFFKGFGCFSVSRHF